MDNFVTALVGHSNSYSARGNFEVIIMFTSIVGRSFIYLSKTFTPICVVVVTYLVFYDWRECLIACSWHRETFPMK